MEDDFQMSDDESPRDEHEKLRQFLKQWGDEKFHVWAHTRSIYNLERLHYPSATRLRSFANQLDLHLSALRALNSDVTRWASPFAKIVSCKFDPMTKAKWEESFGQVSAKKISVEALTSFLKRVCEEYEREDLEPNDDDYIDG